MVFWFDTWISFRWISFELINRGKFFYCLEYTIGAKFKKHRDKDRERDWALIVGATLNKDFEGGKLLSYKPDGELATTQGELYKMNSETIHEVTEVTSGVRYSFVYFITYEELGVPKTALWKIKDGFLETAILMDLIVQKITHTTISTVVT